MKTWGQIHFKYSSPPQTWPDDETIGNQGYLRYPFAVGLCEEDLHLCVDDRANTTRSARLGDDGYPQDDGRLGDPCLQW